MANANNAKKGAVRTKRRERKNVADRKSVV